ncbi:MAG: hypothetical protein H7319_08220 [Spirosoma sp.]|nr:hypothetical protein [Spirosoma sp.]
MTASPASQTTAAETARSLWVVCRQLPDEVQTEFKRLIDEEELASGYINTDWLPLSTPTLAVLWDAPEEDYWDELYAKQHPNE